MKNTFSANERPPSNYEVQQMSKYSLAPYGQTQVQVIQSAPSYAPVPQQNYGVVTSQPTIVIQTVNSSTAGNVFCKHCNNYVMASIDYRVGCYTVLICFVILLFFPLGCCLIPFCVRSCKDERYYCPTCNSTLSVRRRC